MSQAAWRQPDQQKRLASLLARLVIILGLLNIPVECAVAAGPHSMFLAPETVALLQQGASDPASSSPHSTNARTHGTDEPTRVESKADAHSGASMAMGSSAEALANRPHPAMPIPAGFASDAIPLRVITAPVAGPQLVGLPPFVTTWTPPLREHEAAGPEPPPPNLG